MIYIILTTCLFDNTLSERNKQYLMGIDHVKKTFGTLQNCKILIVENNGNRSTFLDHQGIEVLYTNNNSIDTNNRGIKELKDVLDAMKHLNVQDDDFIVKFTGRYGLQIDDCPFYNELKNLTEQTDIIIRYGSGQMPASLQPTKDCITGLIGMRAHIIQKIKMPTGNEVLEPGWIDYPIELCWGEATLNVSIDRIQILSYLGLWMCPGINNPQNNYYLR